MEGTKEMIPVRTNTSASQITKCSRILALTKCVNGHQHILIYQLALCRTLTCREWGPLQQSLGFNYKSNLLPFLRLVRLILVINKTYLSRNIVVTPKMCLSYLFYSNLMGRRHQQTCWNLAILNQWTKWFVKKINWTPNPVPSGPPCNIKWIQTVCLYILSYIYIYIIVHFK